MIGDLDEPQGDGLLLPPNCLSCCPGDCSGDCDADRVCDIACDPSRAGSPIVPGSDVMEAQASISDEAKAALRRPSGENSPRARLNTMSISAVCSPLLQSKRCCQ